MIHVRTLGDISLRTADGQVLRSTLLDHPKRLGLFLYLAREPGVAHQRESLLALFWPDSEVSRARNALRQSLHVIRASLGTEVVRSRGVGCVVVPTQEVSSDICFFHRALATEKLEDALALYGGEYLSGFYIDEVPPFERWVDNQREQARWLAGEAAVGLARRLEQQGDRARALRLFKRARSLAPFNESIARRHIWLLAAVGNRAEAVREYRLFAEQLKVDLGVAPSAATVQLGERVRLSDGNDVGQRARGAH